MSGLEVDRFLTHRPADVAGDVEVEVVLLNLAKQVLTCLRLLRQPLGPLINFGAPVFKDGCKCIVNGSRSLGGSRLRINEEPHTKARSYEEEAESP